MLARSEHDCLGRRHRLRRSSTGKQLRLGPRDVLWFDKLQRQGPLTSTYLHEFSKHKHISYKRALDRLTDLYHEADTDHGGPYLDRPWQQFNTIDARYQDLVYDLTSTSRQVLKEELLHSAYARQPAGPWVHRFMVSCITASIELETLKRPSLRFIAQDEILARAGTTLRTSVAFTNPSTRKTETHDLIPDAIFGIEHTRPSGEKSFRFFLLEADRGTEDNRSYRRGKRGYNFNRKSYLRSILQYREFVGNGLYKSHFNLTAGLLVLNVTVGTRHMENLIAIVQEVSGGRGNNFMLFKTARRFGRFFKPPKPMYELFVEPWQRAGCAQMPIGRF